MTTYVFCVRRGNPGHWDIAKKNAFWDTKYNAAVLEGDDVFFWQSGGSFVAHCRATGARRPITPEDSHPWDDAEEYLWRFPLAVVSEEVVAPNPRWKSEVKSSLGGRDVSIQSGWAALRDVGDAYALASFFAPAPDVVPRYGDDERRAEMEALGFDQREFDLRAIDRRLGQPAFRRALMGAYGGKCAVTGTATASVLEAAHIMPHMGAHTNVVENGLLLRSDIHTLFDRRLLTVTPDLVVRVHPEVTAQEYRHLDRLALLANLKDGDRPNEDLLREHNRLCGWLST